MSKKLIAGAGVVASLAVALAPLATFAADAGYNSDIHTDELNVTVLPTCAFGAANADPAIDGVAHNTASNTPLDNNTNAATWTVTGESPIVADDGLGMTPDAASQIEHPSYHRAAYSIYAGTADANMGSTTLTVVCNQNNGYKIFTEAHNLTDGGDPASYINIVAAGDASASATGYTIAVADDDSIGASLAQVTGTTKLATVTRNAASAATGDDYTYTYGIGVAPSQKAATYTGTVVYTLVQQLGA